ncbi:hypothetical protein EYZ11_001156 [Aspergillus tanneri]|uniref:Uncharacterized protein n=1 Tax=Aspergillus tanneri TaxID=1220188 RepID=A0A4S3JV89_9EURO|nr:hypothetical protein EYZ11_001156 [Aspergillus tanneri]
MWGYALNPPSEGNFIKKAMFACSGRDFHRASTIPCGEPLGTAAFQTRSEEDRPFVIPQSATNIAFLSHFADLPEDTTMGMEYSMRTAQTLYMNYWGLE